MKGYIVYSFVDKPMSVLIVMQDSENNIVLQHEPDILYDSIHNVERRIGEKLRFCYYIENLYRN